MNDTASGEVVLLIASWVAFWVPFIFAPLIIGTLSKEGRRAYQSIMGGIKSAANKTASTGKKAAMNTKYGQAAQQFMGNRKAIANLKGREALRGTLEKNPNLMKLMGGVGGGKYAARYLDNEQRKHEAEQVSNLRQGLTTNVAEAIAKGENIRSVMQQPPGSRQWSNGKALAAADEVAIDKLRQEGYLDQNYSVRPDGRLARASLTTLMDYEMVDPDVVRNLAKLNGSDVKANSLFSETLGAEATKHNYKNLQYGSVSNGEFNQYYSKSEKGIVDSSLAGINKDSLDPNMDMSILEEIGKQYESIKNNPNKSQADVDAFVRKIAEQTKHIDKGAIVESIAAKLSSGSFVTNRDGKLEAKVDPSFLKEFQDLRASIKSSGAIQAPARFSGGETSAPQPAPASPPPTGYTQAPGGSPLVVPHDRDQQPPRPRPGGNFNGPGGGS